MEEELEPNGHDEFKRLDGSESRLPEEEDVNPHPIFLTEHRQINGFNR